MPIPEPFEPVPSVSPVPLTNGDVSASPGGEAPTSPGGEAPAAAPVRSRAPRVVLDAPLAKAPGERETPTEESASGERESVSQSKALPFDETDWLLWRMPLSRFDHHEFDMIFGLWKQNADPRLRERLILMHRNLVMYLARRFAERGELLEDVMQVGNLGLIYAIDSFDPARGVKFSTFAIPTIAGEIRRYFRDKVAGMRVPRRLHDLYSSLQNHVEELTQQLDRSPTYAEIASNLHLEVEEVVEALELGAAIDPNSLDQFAFDEEEGTTLADQIGALDPHIAHIEEYSTLQAALEQLDAKKREVLELTYFQGYSQADVARRLGVSQMHISRLLRRALADLRALLDEV